MFLSVIIFEQQNFEMFMRYHLAARFLFDSAQVMRTACKHTFGVQIYGSWKRIKKRCRKASIDLGLRSGQHTRARTLKRKQTVLALPRADQLPHTLVRLQIISLAHLDTVFGHLGSLIAHSDNLLAGPRQDAVWCAPSARCGPRGRYRLRAR